MASLRRSPAALLALLVLGMTHGPSAGAEEPTAATARRRGRAVFANADVPGCIRCHRVRGEGGDVGPDLSDVGAKLDRAGLIEAIAQPSKQVVEGYRPTIVATSDGRVLTGLVKGESEAELTLVDAEGRRHVVPVALIEERRVADGSLMPDGLTRLLSAEAFGDLVAYLESLRPGPTPGQGADPAARVKLPEGFKVTRAAAGIDGATALDIAPDGRVFVCEQTGAVRVVKDGTLLEQPFARIDVDQRWERGVIGIAIDPRFVENGFVYVMTVLRRPFPHHALMRFTAAGDVADPGSGRVLFEGDDQARNGGPVPEGHQGGAIHIGRDGKLYAAIGDGTAGAPAQSLASLHGKILRLNRDGSIPDDNPFATSAGGKYRAIWALGLRNPFTFAVQEGTGRIFANDVGGDREEIDEILPGANYGWPVVEHGPTRDARFRGPIASYPTASIAGGAFCARSPAGSHAFPAPYRGRYFFMDFVRGWIKVLDPDRPAEMEEFASGLARPVDLRFAPDGSLYVLERDAWVIDNAFRRRSGTLLRIAPRG